jgi:hypothetical protein
MYALCRRPIPHDESLRPTAEDKLAMFFMRLASGTSFRDLGYQFSMSTGYTAKVFRIVCDAFNLACADQIRLPTKEEAELSRVRFLERFQLDNCVGAIDGTHIRVR